MCVDYSIFACNILLLVLVDWSKVQTIDALLQKGGFRGTPTEETRRAIVKVVRYQSEKVNASHSEYVCYMRGEPLPPEHNL